LPELSRWKPVHGRDVCNRGFSARPDGRQILAYPGVGRMTFTAVQAAMRPETTRSWLYRSICGRVEWQRDTCDELDKKAQALPHLGRIPRRKLTGGSDNLMSLKDDGSVFRASDCKTWRVGGNKPSDSHLLSTRLSSPLVTIYRHIPFCAQGYVDDLAVGVALKVVLGQSHSSS
jgi:hypothetical protein